MDIESRHRARRRPGSVAILAWLRMARFTNKVTRIGGEQLRRHGLSLGLFGVLAHVGATEGMSQTELDDALSLTQGNVCQLIDKLERAGLLLRRPEGRTNRLYLTERGQALYDDVVPAHEALIEELFSSLSTQQQAELLTLVRTLDRAVDA
jgi:DNA-binding MarR family transcriptional regulator